MKKNWFAKAAVTALVIILGVFLLCTAFAGTSVGGNSDVSGDPQLNSRLNSLPPFKFQKHKDGIGFGSCPVYSAPSTSAYRPANGRASCQTNAKMDEAGFVNGWLLVRYETNNGATRCGYIPGKYVKGFKSGMAPHFDYIPAVADDTIYVTDDTYSHTNYFGRLEAGEEFYVLSKYNYYANNGFDWWYIECTIDGQTARGFIERNGSSFHLGYDEY